MIEVHAVLLIPEAGDPHGLLREGPCGARVPTAYEREEWRMVPPPKGQGYGRKPKVESLGFQWHPGKLNRFNTRPYGKDCDCDDGGWNEIKSAGLFCGRCRGVRREWVYGREALVLAWDGKPVVEGLDRLGRAWMEHQNLDRVWSQCFESVVDLLPCAKAAPEWAGCTLVLLNAQHQEVHP